MREASYSLYGECMEQMLQAGSFDTHSTSPLGFPRGTGGKEPPANVGGLRDAG